MTASDLDFSARESDFWVVFHIQEVRALKMVIPVGFSGPNSPGVDD